MTGPTLQNAFEVCQTNKAAWMNRKAELAATELEYRDLLLDDATGSRRLQTLRELIDIKKWEINQAAGRISAHMRKYSASVFVTGCMILCSRTARSWPPHWHQN